MKKVFSGLFCVAIVASCLLLAGCGGADMSDSEFVGTWVAQTIDAFGETETTTDISEVLEGGMTMVVNGDGTVVVDFGDGEPLAATWKETRDGFKTKGDAELKFKTEEGGISTNIVGANIHLVKQ